MQELLAVMKTILRRRGEMIPECLNLGNISLNQADYTLKGPEKSIRLGKKEYDILRILLVNRDMVVSKETLLSKVWGSDGEAVDNNGDLHIVSEKKTGVFECGRGDRDHPQTGIPDHGEERRRTGMKEISRLRLKFICYNMLIVTAVIGITFCAAAFIMEKRVGAQGRQALARSCRREEHPLIFTTISPAQIPYFSVIVGEDGMVTPWEGGYESFPGQDFLEQMAWLSMAGEEDMGILEGYHLRYLRVSRPTGYMIAFADTSYEDSLRSGVMKYGGLACAGIWLGFLVLSYFFSRWAVKPVEESIRMQKQFVADASP